MQQRIPGDLPALWRERAAFLREYGDPNAARLWELAAIEFERAWQAFDLETLSLTEAARISGYTSDRLGTLVERGIAEARRRCRRLQIACTDRTNATNPVAPIVSSVQIKKNPPGS